MTEDSYLLAGEHSELERLQLQSRVWEPTGSRLLEQIGDGEGARALDVGCGAMGWLRLLSEWVGPEGEVIGTDVDEKMLSAADAFVTSEGLDGLLRKLVDEDELADLLDETETELAEPGRWGLTFTLVQGWGRRPT